VVIDMPMLNGATAMFAIEVANTIVEHLTINGGELLTCGQMFYSPSGSSILKHITLNADLSKSTNTGHLFSYCANLEIVDGTPLDFSSSTGVGRIASNCLKLREIRFAPLSIKKAINMINSGELTDESTQSIIDGLADLTGQTSQKVELHSDILAKLTKEQINTISSKNWTT
jgi:hypothetical protein